MVQFTLKINRTEVTRETHRAIYKDVERTAEKAFRQMFDRAKKKMVAEFDRHDVTVELENASNNPFGGLDFSNATKGYGNLFSFIGFEQGYNPVQPLRELLIQGTTWRKAGYRDGLWNFVIDVPNTKAIHSVSPMPWEQGSSWVEELEAGTISGLSFYLNTRAKGRSGGGIQAPHEINDDLGEMKKTKYTSEILAKFKDNLLQR